MPVTDKFQPDFSMLPDSLHAYFDVESVVFDSKSGNRLNGWFVTSKDIPPKATILHLHGNGECLHVHHQIIAPLVKQGFRIFTFDYSGFGFSEGKARRQVVLEDAVSALDYVLDKSELRPLVVYGQSLGGHLAVVLTAMRQQDIDALAIEGAFSSHKDIAVEALGHKGVRHIVKEGYSALDSIKNIHKPILVIHSREDKEVPFKLGEKLFNQANAPKEFYPVDSGHVRGLLYYEKEIAQKINKMLTGE